MSERKIILVIIVSITALLTAGVLLQDTGITPAVEQSLHPEGWTDETHGNDVDPNYEIVFPQDKVNQIKITISPNDWETMQTNMTELLGARGTGRQIDTIPEDPIWVPTTIEFNGLIWNNVGVRYKGASTLMDSWGRGTLKIPLRFNFDKYEDKSPEIKDQRFYGFKKLTMANSMYDSSYMRDIIASDILAEAGLPSAHTAYYEVILDYGEGPVNLGLYVGIEAIEHTAIKRYFGSESGNIYKPEGGGASLAEGTREWIQYSFVKKNNESESDWSDIEALYNTLHSKERISASEAWRESLESIFDVDVFLEWLAISAIIQQGDCYGVRPNNYYLYNDPDTGLLTWISWDHDMILGIGDEMLSSESLGRDEVGQCWPLIRYLLDDPIYYNHYVDYIKETTNGPFNPDKLELKCKSLAELITPYITKETNEYTFKWSTKRLIDHIYQRYQVAIDFLADKRT